MRPSQVIALVALSFSSVFANELDVNNIDYIKSTASQIAHKLVQFYHGNETGEIPGVLPEPASWWHAGAMFDTLIAYYNLTGDTQYNAITMQALLHQKAEMNNFMPINQTRSIGNDDQSTWAFAALSASGAGFSPPSGQLAWLDLAKTVFDQQSRRFTSDTCGGGLRWGIYPYNMGYGYMNSASNGQFFELAARLAKITGNTTYVEWAGKSFEWSKTIGLIGSDWDIYDGTQVDANCSTVNQIQWSSIAGSYIAGAAHLYNVSTGEQQQKWKSVLDGTLSRTIALFFPKDKIAAEVACEGTDTCNSDQKLFKGLLGQKLISTIIAAPYTREKIFPLFESTAIAAARTCNDSGCSNFWDGTAGSRINGATVGEQISALSWVQGLLVGKRLSGSVANAGGTPVTGDSNGGTVSGSTPSPTQSGNAGNGLSFGAISALGVFASWMLM